MDNELERCRDLRKHGYARSVINNKYSDAHTRRLTRFSTLELSLNKLIPPRKNNANNRTKALFFVLVSTAARH
jgi:hypothetical protein